MGQFIVNSKNIDILQGYICISGEEYHHLVNVLRKKLGDKVKVISESGDVYTTKITSIANNIVTCEIIEKQMKDSSRKIRINLYQGILKSQKMNFVIQKATELGVNSITPIKTQFVVSKTLDIKRKINHWERIVLSAVKQSNLPFIPVINSPISFTDAISCPTLTKGDKGGFLNSNILNLFLYEKQGEKLNQVLSIVDINSISCVNIFIGPEGGFSENEVLVAKNNGVKISNLGQNTLRSETATITVISSILFWLKEI